MSRASTHPMRPPPAGRRRTSSSEISLGRYPSRVCMNALGLRWVQPSPVRSRLSSTRRWKAGGSRPSARADSFTTRPTPDRAAASTAPSSSAGSPFRRNSTPVPPRAASRDEGSERLPRTISTSGPRALRARPGSRAKALKDKPASVSSPASGRPTLPVAPVSRITLGSSLLVGPDARVDLDEVARDQPPAVHLRHLVGDPGGSPDHRSLLALDHQQHVAHLGILAVPIDQEVRGQVALERPLALEDRGQVPPHRLLTPARGVEALDLPI